MASTNYQTVFSKYEVNFTKNLDLEFVIDIKDIQTNETYTGYWLEGDSDIDFFCNNTGKRISFPNYLSLYNNDLEVFIDLMVSALKGI